MAPLKPPIKVDVVSIGPRIVSAFQRRREAEGRLWAEGYTQSELDSAQEIFGLTFPSDLVALFLEKRPVWGWDWRIDHAEIREMLDRPFIGLLFDVENNGLWWPEWGSRPDAADERAEILRSIVSQAPPLAPLISHRYIPCEPSEAGNPVFSIVQSDAIYYGTNLADYFEREFVNPASTILQPICTSAIKRIAFWSDLVDRNL